ncbi:amidohydrolase family protein [Aspergillus steynii IBT 23096]|uniref:Amidohydrolase family protein n=1 Tax=Aspergillus steynii IBT 23096 TaxID=1392250 RepID=A0A2I2GMZ1_9EURO|nr:amidohydrolase family protein [Aspergillus steynii IBT 23096]PLB54233.1 amidohydrolase family protein [Aspergillus steynii IBT 23096]
MAIPIVDSHIHLFPGSHLPSLAWYGPGGPLSSQHSVAEYRSATATASTSSDTTQSTYLRGFVFVETDRISSVEESGKGWSHALDEVSLLARVITGDAVPGEGHQKEHRHLCLAFIPWAPVPGGPSALVKYIALAKERTRTEEVWRKLRGVRYLVQDKPAGVMLQPDFIAGLKWLGRQGLTFDLGVDARQGGLGQLREAVEMIRRAHEGVADEESRPVVVINHLCKPNLRLPFTSLVSITTHPDFLEWSSLVTAMAQYPGTYMKLSGAFSELPPLSPDAEPDVPDLVQRLRPWTDVIFDAFGPERVLFGSDWPVCNVGGGGNPAAWRRWRSVVEGVLERRGLSEEQRRGVWGQVAVRAYGIDI